MDDVTANPLPKIPLEELLPVLGDDPGLEAHARRLLAEKRSFFKSLARFIYSDSTRSMSHILGPLLTEQFGFVKSCDVADDLTEKRLLHLARQSSFVRLLRVSQFIQVKRAAGKAPAGGGRDRFGLPQSSSNWGIWTPNLALSFRPLFIRILHVWARRTGEQAKAFIARFLLCLKEAAADLTAAGILALVECFLLRSTSAPAAFARLVERLTRRVLAPGGQTARFIPLT